MLYLAFYFPPSRASGVYRARATANHLVEKGWDVTVCAAPLDFLYNVIGSVDEELSKTVDPRIRVERPSLNQYTWQQDLRDYSWLRRSFPLMAKRVYQFSQTKLFPERYSSWAWASVTRALKLHAKQRFDVVVATGNPFASFGAAWLFNKLTGVPYVMDYRDSWTLDLFHDEPAFPEGHIAWAWEKRMLGKASAAVFVNEALRGWHAERYPEVADRMMVVPNGWDADVLPKTAEEPSEESSGERPDEEAPADERLAPLKFAYLGTLTAKQPVEEMAEAFKIARRHPDLAGAELQIHGHLGFFKNSPGTLKARLGLQDGPRPEGVEDTGLRYCGPVSKTEVGRVYEEADVLVFLAGGGRYVTSGKIFEYMAFGHPIVSVHQPGIAAQDVLDGYPLWFNADSLDVEALAASMVAAGKAARDLTPEQREAARRHADTYTREATLIPFERRLREIVGGR
ncbi:glycosyltransferase family 4 protein [Streptomyces somaliensis DSM 40738]|uniref:D-inositol 3-phosphate glycosyltransferase n=1 Tax=Streptomyces somaliensis (strain ATCC 33201 / DSM 40738 / JCM 12659 / KCTC 9044 / NCTC 11332 / NRRL B-12077 / IP 733) TaxID=1134445 RepID=A0AA44DD58_STRE0|nr:glycosyltransferase family 4 protein [Streptomyces somaliensis DSM 40738]